jgi:hypothetical protein
MKNKIKKAAVSMSVTALTLPALALAQFAPPTGTGLQDGGSGGIMGIMKNFLNWILAIVGILGVLGFAIAGILYLTAAGDETRIATAKKAMTWSIVGVVVALLGVVVLKAVSTMLGGSSATF